MIENKIKKNGLLDAKKNGFVSIYALILLNISLIFNLSIIQKMKTSITYKKYDYKLDYVELYAIEKAKNDLLNYEEEKEQITYLGYDILLDYDDITCFISISLSGEEIIKAQLEWDDIEEKITAYTYL